MNSIFSIVLDKSLFYTVYAPLNKLQNSRHLENVHTIKVLENTKIVSAKLFDSTDGLKPLTYIQHVLERIAECTHAGAATAMECGTGAGFKKSCSARLRATVLISSSLGLLGFGLKDWLR